MDETQFDRLARLMAGPVTRRAGLLIVGGGLIAALADPEEAAAATCRATVGGQCWPEAEERKLFNLINQYRVQKGRRELKLNTKLGIAAERHSQYQARTGDSDHTEAAGSKFYDLAGRLRAVKYTGSPAGENVGWHSANGSAGWIFEGWRTSTEGHNEAMLYGRFNEIGMARARGAGGAWYWTAVFGRS